MRSARCWRWERAGRQGVEDDLVRVLIQLLDPLAVDVLLPGRSQHIDEPRFADRATDHLRGERDIAENAREVPRRPGMLSLFLDDEPGECYDVPFHLRLRPERSSGFDPSP